MCSGSWRGSRCWWQLCCWYVSGNFQAPELIAFADSTNRDVKTRKYYVDIAEKLGLPIRCFKFDGSAELAWHNNLYRAYNMSPSTAAALESFDPKQDLYPYFAISGYEKNYEEPTISEGFSEIKTIHWVFDGDAEAERRWSMWLQIDDKKQVQRSWSMLLQWYGSNREIVISIYKIMPWIDCNSRNGCLQQIVK